MITAATSATLYFGLFPILKSFTWPYYSGSEMTTLINFRLRTFLLESFNQASLICSDCFFLVSPFQKLFLLIFNWFRLIVCAPAQRAGTVPRNLCCRAVITICLRKAMSNSYRRQRMLELERSFRSLFLSRREKEQYTSDSVSSLAFLWSIFRKKNSTQFLTEVVSVFK